MNTKKLQLLLSVLFLMAIFSCDNKETEPEETTITTLTTGEGTVSIIPDQSEYEIGTTVEVTAEPDNDWEFMEWTGDISSTENPVEITIDEAKEITAVFELKTSTITTHTTGEGTVSITPEQSEYEHGSTVELIAEPDNSWGFVEWTGDITSTENSIEMTVDGPKEVTAVFEQLTFYLAENGVTIKCPSAAIGETDTVDGTIYTSRTADQITPSNASTTCTSGITDMSELFRDETDFNEDISHWDVSSVTDMQSMFNGADLFNRNISHWDVSSVEDMGSMFYSANAFNQHIGQWEVGNVTDMSYMFLNANLFNGDISNWDVGSVTDMEYMFSHALSFNKNITNWDVANVKNMRHMFDVAASFDQNLSSWCVENIPSEPADFSNGSPLIEDHKPVWGTCPE